MNDTYSLLDFDMVSKYNPQGAGDSLRLSFGDNRNLRDSKQHQKILQDIEKRRRVRREEGRSRPKDFLPPFDEDYNKNRQRQISELENSLRPIIQKIRRVNEVEQIDALDKTIEANLALLMYLIKIFDKEAEIRWLTDNKEFSNFWDIIPDLSKRIEDEAEQMKVSVSDLFQIKIEFCTPRLTNFNVPAKDKMSVIKNLEQSFEEYMSYRETGLSLYKVYEYKRNDSPEKITERVVHSRLVLFLHNEVKLTKNKSYKLTAEYARMVGFSDTNADTISKAYQRDAKL